MPPPAARLDGGLPPPSRDRRLLVALAAAWLAALVPLWWPRVLPLRQLPDALATIAIWQRLGDPSWGHDASWTARALPLPPILHQLFVRALGAIVSVDTANRVLLSLFAAALPASVVLAARRFGRSPWLALLVAPFVWSRALGEGHVAAVMAVPLAMAALALYDRLCEAASPRTLLLFSLSFLAAALCDTISTFLLLACALPTLLAHRPWRRPRSSLPALATYIASTTIAIAMAWTHARTTPSPRGATFGPTEPASEAARLLAQRLLTNWPGIGDELALLALAASWFLLATTAREDGTPAGASPLRAWLPEIAFALCAAAYVAAPVAPSAPFPLPDFKPRLLLTAVVFGALTVRGTIAGRRLYLLAPALAAALLYPLALAAQFHAFDTRAAGFLRLVERIPRGTPTLVLVRDGADPAIGPGTAPLADLHAWTAVLVGGPDSQLADPGHPIAARAAAPTTYKYILTRGETTDGQLAGPAQLVARDGAFRLYETSNLPARPGARP